MSIENDPLLISYREAVYDLIKNESMFISSGKLTAFDQYKKHCGIVSGMKLALTTLDKSIKIYSNDIDEDD